jgi:hypothetical protein
MQYELSVAYLFFPYVSLITLSNLIKSVPHILYFSYFSSQYSSLDCQIRKSIIFIIIIIIIIIISSSSSSSSSSFVNGSTELLLGLGYFFRFLILYTAGRTTCMEISSSQGRYILTGQHNHKPNTHRHPCFEWDLNLRTPAFKRAKTVRTSPRGHSDLHQIIN